MPRTTRSRRYCFTLNNPTEAEKQSLANFGVNCKYLVVGREVGESGTPHLQGYVEFVTAVSFAQVKQLLGSERYHLEPARGTAQQASDYCKKDGDFDEYGVLSAGQGKRTDWDKFKEFVTDLGRVPTDRELVQHNTSLFARYSKGCQEIASLLLPPPTFVAEGAQPRLGFQHLIVGRMRGTPNPRTIDFVVDPQGNSGKSWLCQYALTHHFDKVQVLSVGKRDDVTYVIDTNKSIFLFDVPRGQMMFFRYEVLEQLKNRIIHSNKYQAVVKYLPAVPYVAVFSNEEPDMTALSEDRYNVINV